MVSHEKHLTFLRNVVMGAQAELDGFIDAEFLEVPKQYFITSLQSRYEQGFHDAKAKIMQEEKTYETE